MANGTQIDRLQLADLLDVVYSKANDKVSADPFKIFKDFNEFGFDTPFHNGNVDGTFYKDTTVCQGDKCWKRSDVNYFAQGEIMAAYGDSLEDAYKRAAGWKEKTYGEKLTEDTKYWIKLGWDYYLEKKKQEESNKEQQK